VKIGANDRLHSPKCGNTGGDIAGGSVAAWPGRVTVTVMLAPAARLATVRTDAGAGREVRPLHLVRL